MWQLRRATRSSRTSSRSSARWSSATYSTRPRTTLRSFTWPSWATPRRPSPAWTTRSGRAHVYASRWAPRAPTRASRPRANAPCSRNEPPPHKATTRIAENNNNNNNNVAATHTVTGTETGPCVAAPVRTGIPHHRVVAVAAPTSHPNDSARPHIVHGPWWTWAAEDGPCRVTGHRCVTVDRTGMREAMCGPPGRACMRAAARRGDRRRICRHHRRITVIIIIIYLRPRLIIIIICRPVDPVLTTTRTVCRLIQGNTFLLDEITSNPRNSFLK